MIQVELEQHVIAKSVPFAIAQRKDIGLALDDQHHNSSSATCRCQVWIFLIELVVEFEESFIHEDLDHLIEVSSLIEELGPPFNFLNKVVADVLHALGSTMPIKDCE